MPHPLKTWVKRHPRPDAAGKPSPRMGYETTYGYDPRLKLLIRSGGHNQGGGQGRAGGVPAGLAPRGLAGGGCRRGRPRKRE